MNYCPCCTDKLLRHLKGNKIYWFCLQCRQTMPQTGDRREAELETYKNDF